MIKKFPNTYDWGLNPKLLIMRRVGHIKNSVLNLLHEQFQNQDPLVDSLLFEDPSRTFQGLVELLCLIVSADFDHWLLPKDHASIKNHMVTETQRQASYP